MKVLCFLWVTILALTNSSVAGEYHFKIFEMGSGYANPLQERLAQGGDVAKDAMGKLNSFAEQNRVSLVSDVRLVVGEDKVSSRSSDEKLKPHLPSRIKKALDYEKFYMKGLSVSSPGIREYGVQIHSYYTERMEREIFMHEYAGVLPPKLKEPLLLARWDSEHGIYILTVEGEYYEDTSSPILLIGADVYESKADARSESDKVCGVVLSTVTGTQAKVSAGYDLHFSSQPDNKGISSLLMGFEFRTTVSANYRNEFDPDMELNVALKSISLRYNAQYNQRDKGNERLPNGARVPLCKLKNVTKKTDLLSKEDQIEPFDVTTLAKQNVDSSNSVIRLSAQEVGANGD